MSVLGQAVKVAGSEEGWLRRPAPLLGEQTVEVLGELGYTGEQIGQLLVSNVVSQSAESSNTAQV